MIGDFATDMELPNGTVIDHLKNNPILNVGNNSLLSTTQARYFGLVLHEFAKNISCKQYIHVGYWVISMKYIFINDALKVNVIHPEDYVVDDTEYKVPIGIITVYNSKSALQSTNHLASNSTCRTLERYFQS